MSSCVRSAAFTAMGLAAVSCSSVSSLVRSLASPLLDTSASCEEQPPLVPPLATERRIRVASWNIRYLGPSEETPEETRDPRRLAEYVRQSGASVLALQEIGVVVRDGRLVSPTLDAMFDALRAMDAGDWTFCLYGHPESDSTQFIGLAWDRRALTMEGRPMPLELTGDRPSFIPFVPMPFGSEVCIRKPMAVKLSAGPGLTDIVFVPVHLASRIEMFFFEDATAHRAVEAELVADALERIRREFADDDIVVLGDFNIELASESVSEALMERGLRDLNCAALATEQHGMALDRFYVPADQPEFGLDPNFARVFPAVTTWDEFVEHYSDHLLIVTDVLIGADDD